VDVTGAGNYVQDIRHNAKGQREAIWYGNGTKTGYSYDPLTQRLTRLLTVRLADNKKLQDLSYVYDPVGNISSIRDDAQETVWFNNLGVAPVNKYTYDALYRLVEARGRETATAATFPDGDNNADGHAVKLPSAVPWSGSTTALQHYTQKYVYDAVGNILELRHIGTTAGSYTRSYTYVAGSNRLAATQVSGRTDPAYDYSHDGRGNMTHMPHLSAMDYDLGNQMRHITAGTVQAYYQYSGGQRVRKWVDKGNSVTEERIYYGSYEAYRKYSSGSVQVERTTLHVADDGGRIAMIEQRVIGTAANDNNTAAMLKRFIYSNHLQSASLELDETGAVISYEEYHPYGTTAYQATNSAINAVAKRYRFTGKERDEESGLNYHGARYYIPWLCRWAAVDPYVLLSKSNLTELASQTVYDQSASSYEYCYASPIGFVDSDGKQPHPKFELKLPEIYEGGSLPNFTFEQKTTSGERFRSFLKGVIKGAVITVAVIAIIAATGGLGLTAIAAGMTYAAIGIGAVATVKLGIEAATGKDLLTGEKVGALRRFNMAGELVGGMAGAAKVEGTAFRGGKLTLPEAEKPSRLMNYENYGSESLDIPSMQEQAFEVGKPSIYETPKITVKHIEWISKESIEIITNHFSKNFDESAGNNVMLERLNRIVSDELEATEVDYNFAQHELREAELMNGGMDYSTAHNQTLEEQGMGGMRGDESEKLLYTQEALDADYKQWSK
jgi:RHS repeat-associated protein